MSCWTVRANTCVGGSKSLLKQAMAWLDLCKSVFRTHCVRHRSFSYTGLCSLRRCRWWHRLHDGTGKKKVFNICCSWSHTLLCTILLWTAVLQISITVWTRHHSGRCCCSISSKAVAMQRALVWRDINTIKQVIRVCTFRSPWSNCDRTRHYMERSRCECKEREAPVI